MVKQKVFSQDLLTACGGGLWGDGVHLLRGWNGLLNALRPHHKL